MTDLANWRQLNRPEEDSASLSIKMKELATDEEKDLERTSSERLCITRGKSVASQLETPEFNPTATASQQTTNQPHEEVSLDVSNLVSSQNLQSRFQFQSKSKLLLIL